VDSVYPHVLAWQRALREFGVSVDCEKVHKRIGMSGDLLMRECARDAGIRMGARDRRAAEALHAKQYAQLDPKPRPLDGAIALLSRLRALRVRFGIATSGERAAIKPALKALHIGSDVIVVDGSGKQRAKPAPDLFLKCMRQLRVKPLDCFVIGDAVWDMLGARRAQLQAIGLTCGGYSAQELYQAGAFRVFSGPNSLMDSLPQFGIDD
jgi:HAD superfamily hydrolase (TIGR01549 family)